MGDRSADRAQVKPGQELCEAAWLSVTVPLLSPDSVTGRFLFDKGGGPWP